MAHFLSFINPFLRPFSILLLFWFLYRSFVKKDRAALLLLILAVIIIVDTYMVQGLFLPGLKRGSIRYSEILMALYICGYLKTRGTRDNSNTPVQIRKINILCFLYLLFFLLAVLRSKNPSRELLYSFRQTALAPLIVYVLASWGFETLDDYKRFSYYLLLLAVFISIGSYQMMYLDFIFIKSPTENIFYHAARHNRFGSFFGNPNRLGSFYVLILPTFFIMMFYLKTKLRKMIVFFLVLLIIFALFKTFSRGSYLGFLTALTLFTFFKIHGFPLRKKLALFLAILLTIPVFAPNIYKGVLERFGTIEVEEQAISGTESDLTENTLMASRPFIWMNALKLVQHSPIFGVGWGFANYRNAVLKLEREGIIDEYGSKALRGAEHPHNSYLFIAAKLGCLALVVFLLILIRISRSNMFFFNLCDDAQLRLINFGYICGIAGYLVTIIFDYQLFEKNSSTPFWLLVGLNLSLLRYVSNTRQENLD